MSHVTVTTVKRVNWAHRCDWCDEEIPKGSPATTYTAVEGNFHSHAWRHPECDEASLKVDEWDLEHCSAGTFKRGTDEQR